MTLAIVALPDPSPGASLSVLDRREARQLRTLWRDSHTLLFFNRHPRLAHSRAGRRALRFARAELGWTRRELGETRSERRAHQERQLSSLGPRAAICQVFGRWCGQALAVAYCETGGTYSVYARNGQYVGLFQMGDYARGRYGHSWDALGQARAAFRYFVDSGYGWGPWECKP